MMRLAIDRVLRDLISKDYTIGIVASVSQYNVDRRLLAETSAKPVFPTYKSTTRVDIALLASTLFLQRFGLPFFHTFLSFDFVFAALIFVHQFASGRLFIQYDRLLWFLVVVLAATSSLFLNFESRMLTSYGLFVLIYLLFTLRRPSTPDQYKSTLQGFQSLVLILCCLAIAQFLAQFVVDGRKLIMFFGMVPDFLFAPLQNSGANDPTGTMVKSNGLFLAEPSTMSQIAALGNLIEVLEFRRRRYLIILTLGFLLAYSGTGIMILLLSLPLAALVNRRAQSPVLLVSYVAFGLFATGIIHLSAFTSRVGEFQSTQSSAFERFVSPVWMAADYFPTASLRELLLGNGPWKAFVPRLGDLNYHASGNTPLNLIYQYGLIGAFVFICFLVSCFRRSRCPKPLIAALIFDYLFTGGSLVGTSTQIIIVVLCTLNGPEPRRGRIDEPGQYPSSLYRIHSRLIMAPNGGSGNPPTVRELNDVLNQPSH
jgi:hypothetical protein